MCSVDFFLHIEGFSVAMCGIRKVTSESEKN